MITGLDKMMNDFDQLSKAMAELDGDITQVNFDPNDPASIEQAIQAMEAAIDARVSSYSSNEMVMGIVEELKEKYREGILEKAASARLQGSDGEGEEG
jgi:Mg/Co/Ni transporter MgtE